MPPYPGQSVPDRSRLCRRFRAVALLVLVATCGCGSRVDDRTPPVEPEAPATQAATAEPASPPTSPLDFEPPALEALDRDAKWVDRSVKDAIAIVRHQQANEPPICTVSEALAVMNDSPEANATILSALGRLPTDGEADEPPAQQDAGAGEDAAQAAGADDVVDAEFEEVDDEKKSA